METIYSTFTVYLLLPSLIQCLFYCQQTRYLIFSRVLVSIARESLPMATKGFPKIPTGALVYHLAMSFRPLRLLNSEVPRYGVSHMRPRQFKTLALRGTRLTHSRMIVRSYTGGLLRGLLIGVPAITCYQSWTIWSMSIKWKEGTHSVQVHPKYILMSFHINCTNESSRCGHREGKNDEQLVKSEFFKLVYFSRFLVYTQVRLLIYRVYFRQIAPTAEE